jgi:hypothetical protein
MIFGPNSAFVSLPCTVVGYSTKTAFQFPIPLGIDSICPYSPKLIVEFKFCAKKPISGSFGVENSQKYLKIAKKFYKSQNLLKIKFYVAFHV